MASFNTIPVESETLLAKEQPKTTSMKRLVGGAAIASFVLGVVAATALSATSVPVPPAALHKKNSASGSYEVYIACYDSDEHTDEHKLWSTPDAIGPGGVSYSVGNYPKILYGTDESWGDGFDYVEVQQFTLDNEWAWECSSFGLSVMGPEGQGYRAYDSDGEYLGSMAPLDSVSIGNLNYGGTEDGEGPEALKTSVFLENDGEITVQGNRLLVVSINFKPTMDAPTGYHCIIDEDVYFDGYSMSGNINSDGWGCPLNAPTYYCDTDNWILYYKGSLEAMADGSGTPIDIEFRNGATLEVPLNNMQFEYHLDNTNDNCKNLCMSYDGNKFDNWYDGIHDCWADVELISANEAGLGPVKIYGDGVMAPNGIWTNIDSWPDWIKGHSQQAMTGTKQYLGYDSDMGIDQNVLKANEWFLLGGIIDIMQDVDYKFKDYYGLEVRDITIANTLPRADAAVNHQTCWHLNILYAQYDSECYSLLNNGAMLKNINHISWLAEADGPNLQAKNSKIDTSFLMSADDVIHVSASSFNAYKNVVASGSAGAAVILGSYNEGINEPKIEDVLVNGVFVARAMRLMNGDGVFKDGIGLVDTMTCIPSAYLDLTATVQNLQVAGLGPDVQEIDRLYSISAIDENYGGCGGDNSAPPHFDITLNNFDLQGGSASYPQRVCYYGDDKWDIRLDDTTDIDWDKNCGYDW